jgi:predicted NAD-dependent protein-ADP-ribosyltransferase YbiA (DUF1768 family)
MDETLWHKFTQHSDLKAELLATGDAELVEVLFYFRIMHMLITVLLGLR